MLEDAVFNELLDRYPVFHQVNAPLQSDLKKLGQGLRLRDGQMAFDLDSTCNSFVMPLSGTIRVAKPSESGREILLYRLAPGDSCIITVSCLLGDTPFMACGVTEGDLWAVSIPKELFIRLLEQSRPFRTFVFRHFGQRLTQLTVLIEEVAFKNLDQRLAALLLAQGPSIEATHQMLASELGSVREVVSRLLQDFKEQGAIELERGRITILDEAILVPIAHSCL